MATIMELANSEVTRKFCMADMSGNYSPQLLEAIRRRATELYRRRGAVEGHDAENWYQAEAEIIRESSTRSARRAVIVNVHGVVYTGEYESNSADGNTPRPRRAANPLPTSLARDNQHLRLST